MSRRTDSTTITVEDLLRRNTNGITPHMLHNFETTHPAYLGGRSPYLDHAVERFVVVAVDTAGGGVQSDEALSVYMIAGDRFGLLTARIVSGRDDRYAVTAVPLVYVLSLVETVRTVRRYLLAAHRLSEFRGLPFRLPTVLVVLETNFAYGAAVYIQVLQLIDRIRERHADVADLDLVFATPVYTWNAVQFNAQRSMWRRTPPV